MSNSPYPPSNVKTYMKKYQLQTLINKTINDLLKNTPQDPYAFIIGEMQKLAIPSVDILDIQAIEVISGEGFPALKVQASVQYLSKKSQVTITQPLSILSQENMLYDEDRLGGKGLNKSILFLKEKISPKIKGLKFEKQQEIDIEIERALTENGGQGIYSAYSVSFSSVLIRSQVLLKHRHQLFSQLAENKDQKNIKCMINCLQGGKSIGSKCKVFKYLLVANKVIDPTLIQTVLQVIRKTIVSGKGGEAALKLSPDGTFICPLDTIMDNLKIIEDAIISSAGKDSLGIGLSWQADTLFTADTKKYESENVKVPFDNDQFIDYHIKLLTDKPIICYIEDPLASTQIASWKKLITKIRANDSLKHVKIGTRAGKLINPFQGDINSKINEISVDVTEDSHPDLSPQDRTLKNQLKFTLDYVQIRAFEAKTVSRLIKIYRSLKKVGTQLILQDCSHQTYDTTLVDLAYGLNCFSCLGSINKYDRICKINRMKEILSQK